MDEILAFLKENPTYFLATVDENGNPRIRPFGTITKFEGKLIIQTGRKKDVYKQLKANPKAAISGMGSHGDWIRIECDLVEDPRDEASQAALDEYPSLQNMYAAGDGNCTVFALENITAAYIDSFTEPRKELLQLQQVFVDSCTLCLTSFLANIRVSHLCAKLMSVLIYIDV